MSGTQQENGTYEAAAAAGELLRHLLTDRPHYRAAWEREQRRVRRGPAAHAGTGPGASAVARVLALHLWETGERADTETDLPRRLKDRVHRALTGGILSRETLEWFVGAFAMPAQDATALRARWAGSEEGEGSGGAGGAGAAAGQGPIAHTLTAPQFLPLRQRHRTVSVFERHVLGPDGAPLRHRTTRAIMASEDGVTAFPCRLPPGAVGVRVLRGARVTARHELPGSTPVLELTLPAPLAAGQIVSLEYEVAYGPGPRPATEYRRVAHARAENLDLVVEFPRRLRPRRVWWSTWDDHADGRLLSRSPAPLAPDGSVHRFVPALEHAAAGFHWTW
ncbi:hypothetical protein ACGFXC_06355 [Streptomyces sp. NPDC048507]|uniref:hypothetical protein n=1 Tax=Streptomyces sp. NPDC048507 TaxID=3365560 RepID=UPI00371EB090